MQFLIDQLAEQTIQSSLQKGELDNLQGAGKPLELEDLSMVPEHLRAGYHILKNAGFLPPELEQRQEALTMCKLLTSLQADHDEIQLQQTVEKIRRLELKMRIMGIDTRFIHRYLARLKYPDVHPE